MPPGFIGTCNCVFSNLISSHKRTWEHFLRETVFTYCTFHLSFKDKFPLSGAKTRVQYLKPACFYRYILLCFYYIASGTYCGGSEFKYSGTVAKNVCSIVLEICHTPNPTLNLPDSVGKCKTDLKTHVLMQSCYLNFLTCRFELFCRTIARDSKRSFSLLKYVSVLCELTRSTAIVGQQLLSHIFLLRNLRRSIGEKVDIYCAVKEQPLSKQWSFISLKLTCGLLSFSR